MEMATGEVWKKQTTTSVIIYCVGRSTEIVSPVCKGAQKLRKIVDFPCSAKLSVVLRSWDKPILIEGEIIVETSIRLTAKSDYGNLSVERYIRHGTRFLRHMRCNFVLFAAKESVSEIIFYADRPCVAFLRCERPSDYTTFSDTGVSGAHGKDYVIWFDIQS